VEGRKFSVPTGRIPEAMHVNCAWIVDRPLNRSRQERIPSITVGVVVVRIYAEQLNVDVEAHERRRVGVVDGTGRVAVRAKVSSVTTGGVAAKAYVAATPTTSALTTNRLPHMPTSSEEQRLTQSEVF